MSPPPVLARAPFRRDVQGLRAVAIALVVAWHAGVPFVPGGFIGVDVFFVISGFLITGLLLRELDGAGRIRLAEFWARRARRLLPAALLVLVATALASALLLPREFWSQTATQLAASVLYVENWALTASATDYLAQGADPTPVQHFWSLSVEEQFYLLWPLLLLAAVGCTRVLRRRGVTSLPRTPTRVLVAVIAVATLAGFVAALVWTARAPESAYLATPARTWQFGIGGLLAALPVLRGGERLRQLRRGLGWAGLAAIVVGAVLIDGSTPYPGTAALLPTLGAAAVIASSGDGIRGSASAVLGLAPAQQLGRISYSLYLWHWPVLVLPVYALRQTALGDGPGVIAGLVAVAVLLAVATTLGLEEPMRRGRLARRPPRFTLVAGAAGMVLVLVVAGAGWGSIQLQRRADLALASNIADERCFGAAAIAETGCALAGDRGVVVPSPATSDQDLSPVWSGCSSESSTVRECVTGVRGGTRVALIGDSHAHAWDAALVRLARERGWELHILVKNGCAFSRVAWPGSGPSDPERCAAWNTAVDRRLAEEPPYSLVFTSMRANDKSLPGPDAVEVAAAGFARSWGPLIRRGATVLGIRDVPASTAGTRQCVDRNPRNTRVCSLDQSEVLGRDYLALAAQRVPGARLVEVTDLFCRDGRCPPVIGDVLVYRDAQHLTATYARSAAPYLWRRVAEVCPSCVATG
ncbi:MAG: acyltransferase [Micrococcales bacterium]|nr:acyltransferase [Micrococcales bacterium]